MSGYVKVSSIAVGTCFIDNHGIEVFDPSREEDGGRYQRKILPTANVGKAVERGYCRVDGAASDKEYEAWKQGVIDVAAPPEAPLSAAAKAALEVNPDVDGDEKTDAPYDASILENGVKALPELLKTIDEPAHITYLIEVEKAGTQNRESPRATALEALEKRLADLEASTDGDAAAIDGEIPPAG